MKFRIPLLGLAACAALAGCIGNNGDSLPPPTGVQPISGDGYVGVSWASQVGVEYYVFAANNPSLTPSNFADTAINGFPLNNFGTAQPPDIFCGAANGLDYFFTITAHTGSAPGGPGSPDVLAVARPAGSSWRIGGAIAGAINGIGYAQTTTCLPYALPTGLFVAVGPAGKIFTSPDGINWTQRSPATADLYGVAALTGNVNNPGASAQVFIAVGAGGAVARSTDGITWNTTVVYNPGVPTLRSVAFSGSVFVAVGDTGRIQTSPDGVTWTVQVSNTSANLHSVRCVGAICYAVGDNGLIDVSSSSGLPVSNGTNASSWTAVTVGGGNFALRDVVYGNYDYNWSNGVIGVAGVTAINTWVAVGDAGAVFVNNSGTWVQVPLGSAPNLVGIGYSTRFLAIDAAGNAYASQTGAAGTWSVVASTGVTDAVAIAGSGNGFVTVGSAGDNASSF